MTGAVASGLMSWVWPASSHSRPLGSVSATADRMLLLTAGRGGFQDGERLGWEGERDGLGAGGFRAFG
jgi:hypothetical protein